MSEKKTWRIEIHRIAEKGIKKLPRELVRTVWDRIRSLETDPYPKGCIRLQGSQDLYRFRVGDFRIIYAVLEDQLLILVLEVGPRSSVYKNRYR